MCRNGPDYSQSHGNGPIYEGMVIPVFFDPFRNFSVHSGNVPKKDRNGPSRSKCAGVDKKTEMEQNIHKIAAMERNMDFWVPFRYFFHLFTNFPIQTT